MDHHRFYRREGGPVRQGGGGEGAKLFNISFPGTFRFAVGTYYLHPFCNAGFSMDKARLLIAALPFLLENLSSLGHQRTS